MRAKYGSQILKFQHPSGGFPRLKPFENPEGFDQQVYNMTAFPKEINWQPNSYMEANEIPTPKLDATDISLPNNNSLSWKPRTSQLYQNTTQPQAPKLNTQFETPEGFPEYLESVSEFNVNTDNFMKDLKGNKFTYNPYFQRKTTLSKNGFGKIIGGISNFTKNNPNLSAIGLDITSSIFNKSVDINSKGYNNFSKGINTIGNVAMMIPGLQGIGLATKGVNAVASIVNSIGKKKLKEFGIDPKLQEWLGGSYEGSNHLANKVKSFEGKTVGTFTGTGKFNKQTDEANRQKSILTDIYNNRQDQLAMINNDMQYQAWNNQVNGIISDPRTYMSAKKGGSLIQKIDLVKSRKFNQTINVNTKQIEEFKEGGNLPELWEPIIDDIGDYWEPIIEISEFQEGGKLEKSSFEDWFNSIPENNRANQYDYEKAYEVFDWETLSKHAKDPENNHLYSVSPIADENGNYPFLKLGKIEDNPEIQGEFDWYNSEEGKEHKSKFDIEYINDRYYYVPKKFKKGGKTKEELETPEIEETNQKNLIPEGALHKNKHHMEHTEGLTQKGIPVIDNDGEQQAEIELNEIIFTLEVTKKLEELYKEGTDEAAIEAGKLLVKEILFNTDDRTDLIAKCEKGGKL